jgi:mono/diheme cytochrome c family protein
MLRKIEPILCAIAMGVCISADVLAETGGAAEVDYKKLKNPVKFTKSSIAQGRVMYVRLCAECHGPDGKAEIDIVANATNLTEVKLYHHGATAGEIFRSIKLGAGADMPAFKDKLTKDEDIWRLVNFIQSLWPEDRRPKVEEDEKKENATKDGK